MKTPLAEKHDARNLIVGQFSYHRRFSPLDHRIDRSSRQIAATVDPTSIQQSEANTLKLWHLLWRIMPTGVPRMTPADASNASPCASARTVLLY